MSLKQRALSFKERFGVSLSVVTIILSSTSPQTLIFIKHLSSLSSCVSGEHQSLHEKNTWTAFCDAHHIHTNNNISHSLCLIGFSSLSLTRKKKERLPLLCFDFISCFFHLRIPSHKGGRSTMRITFSACKQAQPLVTFPGGLNVESFIQGGRRKDKVVIVMGATGTGKSRLSIELATRFPAEIVNSDKMQVYKGLDIVTNKVTEEECRGVPHHLLGITDPDTDFTASDFRHHASLTVESILQRDRLPVIAGGSNSYIKAFVSDEAEFRSKYECCFLWVDVSMPVLHSFVSKRVDKMVEAGLVEEVKKIFDPKISDYTRGIRRSIGVPEMDTFFRVESTLDAETRAKLLRVAIDEIKNNTCKLACRQLQNILRLQNQLDWNMHHLDATEIFLKCGPESDEAWERLVAEPSTMIVNRFLYQDDFISPIPTTSSVIAAPSVLGASTTAPAVVAAATH